MFRKCLFWMHLCSGVAAGIVVLTMSVTGVALTYERQMQRWAAEQDYVPVTEQGTRLPLDELVAIQRISHPEIAAASVTLTNNPGAPVDFRAGRRGGVSLNPFTGEAMEVGSPALSGFFSAMTGFHRWFLVEGENRAIARQVTGVSNVIFLFLVLSGMYLWLPRLWNRAVLKARLMFRSDYPSSKVRDFHWHHIFGIWAALPLVAVVYSGAVISYPWAANAMYRVFGAEVPQAQTGQQAGGAGTANPGEGPDLAAAAVTAPVVGLGLDELIQRALVHSGEGWNRVNLTLPKSDDASVRIEIDKGNGAQAQLRHTLTLDRSGGQVLSVTEFRDTPKAQRLRGIARFLHTGEVLGFWGQTLAGLASFAALFLVWTGFALSWRRLVQPLYKKP